MQLIIQDKIDAYLERKFRLSRSYSTRESYKVVLHRFIDFVQIHYKLDFSQFLRNVLDAKKDPIEVLDEYFSYLAGGEKRYSSNSIRFYLTVAKDFLNYNGCKIYIEDLKQRFRLPKSRHAYEEGFTKETINRLVRFANPKLATSILMICSSGMRISELMQVRLEDIDFTKNPTTIHLRAETTKTRETRIVCISSEATNALQDYLKRYKISSGYLFISNEYGITPTSVALPIIKSSLEGLVPEWNLISKDQISSEWINSVLHSQGDSSGEKTETIRSDQQEIKFAYNEKGGFAELIITQKID